MGLLVELGRVARGAIVDGCGSDAVMVALNVMAIRMDGLEGGALGVVLNLVRGYMGMVLYVGALHGGAADRAMGTLQVDLW